MTTLLQDTPVENPQSKIENSPHMFHVGAFRWEDRHYVLKQAVECLSFVREGVWVFECPRYGLSAFAAGREEAWAQFGEEFAFLYDGLLCESDDTLTGDALALRDLLRADVAQVEALA